MKRISWKNTGAENELRALYERPACPQDIEKAVSEIVGRVRHEGDGAIVEFLRRFDAVEIPPDRFVVRPEEYAEAEAQVDSESKRALAEAIRNVTAFACESIPKNHSFSPRPGVTLGERFTPMRRIGCYIPGGTAPLVSTSIHTVAIAKAAGVREIAAVTPPMKNGKINPATLYALRAAGATEVWRMGGAYAIAAMAYGTNTVKKVDKIVGPGNAYVAAAKKIVYGSVAIDMVAGPSEILVVADSTTNPAFAAADMLSQAEHGSGLEQSVCVSDSAETLDRIEAEVVRQSALRKRSIPVAKVMKNGMFFIECRDRKHAAEIASAYAPEHIELLCANPHELMPMITAAGAIFLGPWTPEPAGDFTAGPSHVLPTAGTAKFFHGLSSADFMCRSSFLEYSQDALKAELPSITRFAELEGLDGHGASAAIRFQ